MKPILFAVSLCALTAAAAAVARDPEIYKAYDGTDVPVAQQVVLKIAQNYPGFHLIEKPEVGIVGYDGKRVSAGLSGVEHADEVRFLPGKHVIAFRVKRGTAFGYVNRWFVGTAGQTYSTQLESKIFSFDLSIKDDATGKPTGGKQGSSDEPRGSAPPSGASPS